MAILVGLTLMVILTETRFSQEDDCHFFLPLERRELNIGHTTVVGYIDYFSLFSPIDKNSLKIRILFCKNQMHTFVEN